MCLEGKQECDREDGKVTGSWGLYLNTCISSGEFCTSSWRRRQRRQALSSCCSWASWGASCLEHRRTNTHAQNSHCCPLQSQGRPMERRALFQGGWHRQPPLCLVPHRESPSEQHPAGPQSPDSTCLSRLRLPVLTPRASHNGRLSGAGRPPSLFSTCSLRAGKC